jgi:hypothetical protein
MTTNKRTLLSFDVWITAAVLGLGGCHSSPQGTAGGTGGMSAGGGMGGAAAPDAGGGGAGGGQSGGGGGSSSGGSAGQGAGGSGAGGMGGAGAGGTGGAVSGGGAGGEAHCTPGVEQTIITDCGYPRVTSSPLSSVVFNESEVLRAIVPSGGAPTAVVRVFYNDEHALTLGVRQVVTKGPAGMMTTDYPISPLASVPSSVMNPMTGTNELVGPQSGLDVSLRPMWPALFITDISADPNNRSATGRWAAGRTTRTPSTAPGRARSGPWTRPPRPTRSPSRPTRIP